MTQCPYPPPLTDFDSFRRRPPRPMFAPTLEALVMMTGRKKTGKEKLENNIETTDTLTSAIDLDHILPFNDNHDC